MSKKLKRPREKRFREKKEAKGIFDKINNKTYEVKKLSTENKELYGSVKPTEISKIIKEYDNVDINSSLIQPINEIKTLGKFKVTINLHSEIQASIVINVLTEEISK